MNIRLFKPSVGKEELANIKAAFERSWIGLGPNVNEFEKKFSEYLKTKKAVSVQSGTAAMHMALYALGIGKGDEVIVPALTFIASANPILYMGAKPVFCDIDKNTWNIDPKEIESRITKKTKAILVVHFYGNPCDMDAVMKIAKKHKLYVIEDATESLGASYKKKHTGLFGDFGCFSFNGNKVITTGGGGMIVGKDRDKLSNIKFLANQAKDAKIEGYHPQMGFNYRMTNLEAGMGLAQLKKLGKFLKIKRNFNNIYRQELKDIHGVRLQEENKQGNSSWWLNALFFEEKTDIEGIRGELKKKNIPSRRVFMPLTEFPPYRKYKKGVFRNSYDIYERGLCLPSSTLNSADDIRYACKSLKEILRGKI